MLMLNIQNAKPTKHRIGGKREGGEGDEKGGGAEREGEKTSNHKVFTTTPAEQKPSQPK